MKEYTLITGASSGIGLELAHIALREKRNVILVARDERRLKDVQVALREQYPKNKSLIEILALDLAKSTAAQKVFAFCEENQFFVSELVNNAGFGDYGNFAGSDVKRQLSMIDLNVKTLTELTHFFLPAMLKNKRGRILNLGSIASFLPGPLMSVYFATKNYVLSFSRALSEELRGTGVTVTCLCPGATSTGFGKNAHVSATHATAHPKTTAREVAEFGWYQMQQGKSVAIYSLGNRLAVQTIKFVPRNLLTKLVKKLQK